MHFFHIIFFTKTIYFSLLFCNSICIISWVAYIFKVLAHFFVPRWILNSDRKLLPMGIYDDIFVFQLHLLLWNILNSLKIEKKHTQMHCKVIEFTVLSWEQLSIALIVNNYRMECVKWAFVILQLEIFNQTQWFIWNNFNFNANFQLIYRLKLKWIS